MNKFFGWMKDHAPTILSWCASAGTIGGAYAAVKAVDKARDRIREAKNTKLDMALDEVQKWYDSNPEAQALKADFPERWKEVKEEALKKALSDNKELTRWERIKAGAPAFWMPALIELGTIGCIQGADILNRKNIGKMSRTITGLKEALAVGAAGAAMYKENVARIDPTVAFAAEKMAVMEEADKQEEKTAWDEPQTFYIDGQPEFFERTMLQVFQAEVALNRQFAMLGQATQNDFYRYLDLPEIPEGDKNGWEDYLGEVYYGYRWIDFRHEPYQLSDGMWITEIVMPFEPHPLDEDEVNRELDESLMRFNSDGVAEMTRSMDDPPFQPDPRFG